MASSDILRPIEAMGGACIANHWNVQLPLLLLFLPQHKGRKPEGWKISNGVNDCNETSAVGLAGESWK